MRIERDAILRIVRSVRNAENVANIIRTMCGNGSVNLVDRIASELQEALFIINGGEETQPEDEFHSTFTMRTLEDETLTDEQVTDVFIRKAEEREPKMPKPNLVSRDRLNEMLGNCGYKPTPEGEWK